MTSATIASAAVGPTSDELALFRAQGYLVLPAVFPAAAIERWRRAFLELLERQMASEPANRGTRRYQTYLPFAPPFDEPGLTAHPRVLATVRALLGDDCVLQLLGADTPLPGAQVQTVHMDTVDLAPGVRLPATYVVCVNVPLVDYTAENGPLELWPGTHLVDLDIGGDSSGTIGPIQALAERVPSQRPLLAAGDVLVRDLRLWHRGTPNRSSAPRPNLALTYTRPWFRLGMELPTMTRERFDRLPAEQRRVLRYATVR